METDFDRALWNTNYPYIFVHGLSGWGDYNSLNSFYSYWGLNTGSIPNKLSNKGFNCACASMNPVGSSWDRACELYAQLTGTVVDYGLEHSTRCNHARYGQDYSNKALIEKWDRENKINLVGHSFGGITSRMLIHLLEEGSAEERAMTDKNDLSPLFEGGHSNYVHCLVTIATPHNGVSAMEIHDEGFDVSTIVIKHLERAVAPIGDGRVDYDCTGFDMHIDEAAKFNEKTRIRDETYYFSIPVSGTFRLLTGQYIPIKRIMEPALTDTSILIGKYSGTTSAGLIIDDKWRENDGLVNLISAKAPFTEPAKEFDINSIEKGIWNIMPTVCGDHLSLVGGFSKKYDVMSVYVPLFDLINRLE